MQDTKTILIIEDNDRFREHISGLFTSQGYRVLQAKGGEEGWNYITNESVSLVILDMVMPGKNGQWFVETIRTSSEYEATPIIIFTNLSHGENIGKVLVKGISRMLVKEHTSDSELAKAVSEVLSESHS